MAAALTAVPAGASPAQRSIVEDDLQLVGSGPVAQGLALDDVAALGADTVRSVVGWARVAPGATARRPPAGFAATDPAAYPAAAWDPWDGLVRGARARGLDVLLSPAGPVPAWASRCRPRPRRATTCEPSPAQFERFVRALGTRYSGTHRDEDEGGGLLPRVDRWSIWNEPNQGGWLTPQLVRRGGHVVPRSPVLYRELARAAIAGLRASGHGADEILLGETAPLGRTTGPLARRPTAPGAFLRGVLCLDGRGRSLTGAARRALACAGARRLAVTGIAHHPYSRGGSQPPTAHATATEITISSAARLERLVDEAGARGRLPRHLPISYTEFGFQTDPPDTLLGVSLTDQAAFLNESDWIAYRDPRIASVAQYELRDEAAQAAFQTGLRFLDGRPKPGYDAYRLPIWVSRTGARLRVWGQVRPAGAGARETVAVQHAAPGNDDYTTLRRVQTKGAEGFVDTTIARQAGTFRLQWTPAGGGATLTSRVAGVGR